MWRKRARAALAILGAAVAILVYTTMGTRSPGSPVVRPERLDPRAVLESIGAQVQQGRGVERDFDVKSARQFTYKDGSTRLVAVEISVRGRAGRDFLLTGEEAEAKADQAELQLTGGVRLAVSDGLTLTAERASFNRADALVHAPGPISFAKGDSLNGTGVGMSYHEASDVLTIAESARIGLAGQENRPAMGFTASTATFSRADDMLRLGGDVRVRRGTQTLEGDSAVVRLSPDDDVVTFIELRGNAKVGDGGESLQSMAARDIDLDYTDDGQMLEHVRLVGDASILTPARAVGAPGRQIRGERLDLSVASDGAITAVTGMDGVELTLPASDVSPSRTILAQTLDGRGEPRLGLTSVGFSGDVEYRELAGRSVPARLLRSQDLTIELDGDSVSTATFGGGAQFEEQDFQGAAADVTYDPGQGTLRLAGHEAGAPPHITDSSITVEGDAIEVRLRGRQMTARGTVRTTLRPQRPGSSSTRGDEAIRDHPSRLPGLLQDEEPANLSADSLEYGGTSGTGIYRGNAALWQGATAIRAGYIMVDQQTGNLLATGNARSTIALERGVSVGRAEEIRYDDARRTVTYRREVLSPERPVARTTSDGRLVEAPRPLPGSSAQPQLSGPQGDLRADHIELFLATGSGRADKIEANTGVTIRLGERVATGVRLTYFTDGDRYVMLGTTQVPVTVADGCREATGRTLTFFGSTDRVIVDGNEEVRTYTKSGGPCAAAPAR